MLKTLIFRICRCSYKISHFFKVWVGFEAPRPFVLWSTLITQDLFSLSSFFYSISSMYKLTNLNLSFLKWLNTCTLKFYKNLISLSLSYVHLPKSIDETTFSWSKMVMATWHESCFSHLKTIVNGYTRPGRGWHGPNLLLLKDSLISRQPIAFERPKILSSGMILKCACIAFGTGLF